MQPPLFLQPVFKERIWGGTALRERFGYDIPSDHTGECWAISGHPNGESIVREGPYQGMSLGTLWNRHRELFGHFPGESFPLLTKILDASEDLSVQVHPDDAYAHDHENGERGKTECWYILDCQPGAELIFGHYAQTREELEQKIHRGEWSSLLRKVPIRPGDFFYVPSGTIHALCAGTLVLETQQSSDTTYRLYDYDRRDGKGNRRELHINQALDVIQVPHHSHQMEQKATRLPSVHIVHLVKSPYFSVFKWSIQGEAAFPSPHPFMLASVIAGNGELLCETGSFPFRKGDHLIFPAKMGSFQIHGQSEWILSCPEQKTTAEMVAPQSYSRSPVDGPATS
ncbi:mannose-6-phosphate isomerase ManA [Marinithermofilum abyssi]|uniref:Mannose-6-phosphate isomerase n=1 Tax=Marinithermofilum abyssi TaxID=1571185 RepID=A0A8J2VIS1_9BACL|nr:mannose-6-phosphate isomerase, class I [Marinithermofilum abyssi]GGE24332.1 mannose-6-phosphate isomerase ManA [Marinithermofilum abyssi]